jgi:hypothetical protein
MPMEVHAINDGFSQFLEYKCLKCIVFLSKKIGSRWKLDQDPSAPKTDQYPDPLYVKLHPEFKLSVERENGKE